MEIKIFITYNCNLNCRYCFVTHDRNANMDYTTLREILRWAISLNEPSKVILTGGEPTSRFDLIIKAAEYVRDNDTDKKIKFDYIPTNGTLLTKEMIKAIKALNIEFAFSLDGYGLNDNKFRYTNNSLYKKLMDNLRLYMAETKTVPRIKLTVNPDNSNSFYDNVKSLLINGLNKIQILPAFGVLWSDTDKKQFLSNFDRILRLHCYLKSRNKKMSLDPIDWYIQMIQQSNFSEIAHNNCDMGKQVSFTPFGEAYACLAVIHLKRNEKLRKRFYLGTIHEGVDIKKISLFQNYRICQETPELDCRYYFPNISCKKICATLDFKTGKRISKAYTNNLNEIENYMFHKTYDFYFKSGKDK
ncbi:MAG: radical SAM protein [Candidatus Omnitrophota bacterium]